LRCDGFEFRFRVWGIGFRVSGANLALRGRVPARWYERAHAERCSEAGRGGEGGRGGGGRIVERRVETRSTCLPLVPKGT
jgi:hypothetical protein